VSFLAAFIMKGRMQAILVTSLLALVSLTMHLMVAPFIIIVSFASVALVTLRQGGREGFFVLLLASVITAMVRALLEGEAIFLVMMLISCISMWLPVWLAALVLRETRHLALAIELSVFIGTLGVIGFYLYVTEPAKAWQIMFEPMLQSLPPEAPVDGMREAVQTISHYMTGIFAASTVFSILAGLFLGRWWQSVLYNPGGFKQEFLSLRTGQRLAIISIVLIIVAKVMSGMVAEIAWNILILLFVLYLFIGTSVLHTQFAKAEKSRFWVPMLYITLFLVPHVMLPVALVGLCDAWLNLRKIPSTPAKK
jgi:hypothetical protein